MVDVLVTGGTISGVEEKGLARFLGVPYAAPPFGEGRMRPPGPVAPWSGPRDATAYGATVPKGDYPPQYRRLFPEPVIAGEDCLNLNVWTPADAVGHGSLPVLVFVHGGAFVNGSGAVSVYDGSAFARDGVVCVTINYRLGAEGFLFTGEADDAQKANIGLKDQIAALRWVHDNIGAFGGDPSRVTVAGESAGAMSVTALMAMPAAVGMFAQAITQSGAAAHTLPPETAVITATTLAGILGVEPTRAAIAAAAGRALVQAVAELVQDAQNTPDPTRWGALALRILPFAPVVDGDSLPRHPLEAAAGGASRDVKLMLGSNRQEGRLFLVAPGLIDSIDEGTLAQGAAAYGLPPNGVDVYRRNHPGASPGDLLAQIITDWYFAVPGIRLAEAHAEGGGTSWSYLFDHPGPEQNHRLGAAHAVELPYVFDTIDDPATVDLIGDAPSRAVAASTHAVWVRFITHGDPGWPRFTTDSRTTGVLAESVTVVDDPHGDERVLWDGVV